MKADLIPWARIPESHEDVFDALSYEKLAREQFSASDMAFASEISSRIPVGFTGKVVDLGSGPGNIAVPLAKLRPDLSVICYDINQTMLDFAQTRANTEHVRLQMQQGDFTQIAQTMPDVTNAFVFSNTALHEIPNERDLPKIFAGIAHLVGDKGGCYIRDLRLPKHQKEADVWKGEIVNVNLFKQQSPNEYRMFNNSQHAGFTADMIRSALEENPLLKKGKLLQGSRRNKTSRYWMFSVEPSAFGQSRSIARRGGRK